MGLVGRDGQPTPPSEVVRRLEQVNPRLGVRVQRIPGQEGYWWAFTLAWASEDPRWQLVQRGDMSPDSTFDIIGQLPRDAGVDEAYGYFVASAKAIHDQGDRDAILARAERWAQEPFEQLKAEAGQAVEEAAEELFRGPKVATGRPRGRPKGSKDKVKRKAARA